MAIERIAFFAFEGITFLDLVGGYDSLRRTGAKTAIIGTEDMIADESGMRVAVDAVYPDLAPFDLLYVPGGMGTRALQHEARVIDYLRSWGDERPLASVCTGAILIGQAGHLRDLRATTHHLALDELRPLCREVAEGERIVDEGRVVTAAGVSSSLDLGLHLVAKYWDLDTRERIAARMEYTGGTT